MNLTFTYIGLIIFLSGLLSLLLLYYWQRNHLLKNKPFFWHWMVGFALYALVHTPVILINAILNGSVSQIAFLNFAAFFAALTALLFFYRGALYFLTPSHFWKNIFPAIWFLSFTLFALWIYVQIGEVIPIVSTVFVFGASVPLAVFLGIVFFRLYQSGNCFVDHKRRSIGPLLISLAWFGILALDLFLWQQVWQTAASLEVIPEQLAMLEVWYLARAISLVPILIGIILLYRCLPDIKSVTLQETT